MAIPLSNEVPMKLPDALSIFLAFIPLVTGLWAGVEVAPIEGLNERLVLRLNGFERELYNGFLKESSLANEV